VPPVIEVRNFSCAVSALALTAQETTCSH